MRLRTTLATWITIVVLAYAAVEANEQKCAIYDSSPFSIPPGAERQVWVTVENCGTEPLDPTLGERLSYIWYDGANQRIVDLNGARTAFPAAIGPGESLSFLANVSAPYCQGSVGPVAAPCSPGSYTIRWDIVRDPLYWFSQKYDVTTADLPVMVRVLPPPPVVPGEPARAPDPVPLFVDNTYVRHPEFLGISTVLHGFSYMPESTAQGMTEEWRAFDFERLSHVSPTVVRTWYGDDWAMPEWGGPFDWNSEKMQAFYAWLEVMQNLGIEIAIHAGWWFPDGVCQQRDESGCIRWELSDDIDIYTRWISESVHQIVTVRGFTNVKYLLLFAEPNLSAKPGNDAQTWEFYSHVASSLHGQLLADGTRDLVQLVGPNTYPLGAWLSQATSQLNSVLDVYSSHDYSLQGYETWRQRIAGAVAKVEATGKPFWIDEYGHQNSGYREKADYGTYLAEVNAAAMNAGVESTFLWLYQDQYYVRPLEAANYPQDSMEFGLHKWGTHPWIPDSREVRPAWHSFALMARLFHDGGEVYESSDSIDRVRVAAVGRRDGGISLLVVNSNTVPKYVRIAFASPIDGIVERFVYHPSAARRDDAPLLPSEIIVANDFEDRLPPRAVVIYTSR